MIKLIFREAHIARIPERWREQYPVDRNFYDGRSADEIHELLSSVKDLTKAKADGIIGNDSWTEFECEVCGEDKPMLVTFTKHLSGKEINICPVCLSHAIHEVTQSL